MWYTWLMIDVDKAEQLYRSGQSIRQIALTNNWEEHAVAKLLKNRGVDIKKRGWEEKPHDEGGKQCNKCGEYKPYSQYYRTKMNCDGYQGVCKHCDDYRRNENRIKNKYGIDVKGVENLLLKQGGRCAICRSSITFDWMRKDYNLHIDHDHMSKKVRGLLCSKCNMGLGCLGDTTFALERALSYLERNGEWE